MKRTPPWSAAQPVAAVVAPGAGPETRNVIPAIPPGGWTAPAAASFDTSAATLAVQTFMVLPRDRLAPVLSRPTSFTATLATGGTPATFIPSGEPVTLPVPGDRATVAVRVAEPARFAAEVVTVIVAVANGASPG